MSREQEVELKVRGILGVAQLFWQGGPLRLTISKGAVKRYEKHALLSAKAHNALSDNSSRRENGIKKIIVAGFILREFFSFWTGHYDFEVFVRVGYYVANGGNPYSYLKYVNGISFLPYDVMTSIGYPPFMALFAAFAYLIANYLSLNRFLYYFLLKQPMILSDIAIGFMLFKLVKEMGGSNISALRITKYWVFNPFTIIISSIWGMVDPLVIFLLLLSLHYFLKNDRYKNFLAGAILGSSVFIKQFSLIYIPLFSLAKKRPTEYLLVPILTVIILTVFPFVVFNWSYEGFYLCMRHQAFEKLTISEIILFPFSELLKPFMELLSMIWLSALILVYLSSFRLQTDIEAFVRYCVLVTIVFLATRIVVSEQLFEYPLIFILLYYAVALRGDKFYRVLSFTLLAYLVSNNTLLVRFLSPLTIHAHFWDLYVNNNPPFDVIRSNIRSILFILVLATCIDLVLYCFDKKNTDDPFLITKLKFIKSNKKETIFYSGYFIIMLILNIALWLNQTTLFIFMMSLLLPLIVSLCKTRETRKSLAIFVRLLLLNFLASSITIPLHDAMIGLTPLGGRTLNIISNIALDEREAFEILSLTGLIGLLFMNEIISAISSITGHLKNMNYDFRINSAITNVNKQYVSQNLERLYFIQLTKEQELDNYAIRRTAFLASEIIRYIKNLKTNYILIVDLGSGRGLVEKHMSILKTHIPQKQLNIICADLNIKLLSEKWIGGECERILAFLPWIPLKEKSANIVILSEVLEHLPTELTFPLLKRIYQILVNNGLLIITTPNVLNYTSRLRALIIGRLDLMDDFQHFQEFSFKVLKEILEQAGFKVKRVHFDVVMSANGILSNFAMLIPYRLRRIFLRILPELDKLIVIRAYKWIDEMKER